MIGGCVPILVHSLFGWQVYFAIVLSKMKLLIMPDQQINEQGVACIQSPGFVVGGGVVKIPRRRQGECGALLIDQGDDDVGEK